jgi:hypothetical protein
MDDLLPLPFWQPKALTAENLHFKALLQVAGVTVPAAVGGSGGATPSSSGGNKSWQPMVTASMVNWDSSDRSIDALSSGDNSTANTGKSVNNGQPIFEIDGEKMFLPTATFNEEFFVAL